MSTTVRYVIELVYQQQWLPLELVEYDCDEANRLLAHWRQCWPHHKFRARRVE
jgi:hypothetical protein